MMSLLTSNGKGVICLWMSVPCQPCLHALFHFGTFGELFRQPVALFVGGLAEALVFDDLHDLRYQSARTGKAQDEHQTAPNHAVL